MTTQLYIPNEEAIILEKLLAESIGIKQDDLMQYIRKDCATFFRKHLYDFLFAPLQDEEEQEDLKAEILSLWTNDEEALESALSGLSFVIEESREIATPYELQRHVKNRRRRSENLLGGTETSFLVVT